MTALRSAARSSARGSGAASCSDENHAHSSGSSSPSVLQGRGATAGLARASAPVGTLITEVGDGPDGAGSGCAGGSVTSDGSTYPEYQGRGHVHIKQITLTTNV